MLWMEMILSQYRNGNNMIITKFELPLDDEKLEQLHREIDKLCIAFN